MTDPLLSDNRRNETLSEADAQSVAAQLRKPEGDGFLKITEAMNASNETLIKQTLEQFSPQRKESILEIGPGNGAFLKTVLDALGPQGKLTILDHSADILKFLKLKYSHFIDNKLLHLSLGGMGKLDFESESFEGIYSVNTLYFWDDPKLCLQELMRVLKPGGRLTLGMRSKKTVAAFPFTKYGFKLYDPAEVIDLLESQGFEVRLLLREWEDTVDCLSITAFKV